MDLKINSTFSATASSIQSLVRVATGEVHENSKLAATPDLQMLHKSFTPSPRSQDWIGIRVPTSELNSGICKRRHP
jgi:hypothetical protein